MSKLNKYMMKAKAANKGFTLVELIIVIAIIVVLALVLAPQYTRYVERSRQSNDLQIATNLMRATTAIVADPKSEIPADEVFSVQLTTAEGSPRLVVWYLDGDHSSGEKLSTYVELELASIMGFTEASRYNNSDGTTEIRYDAQADSEAGRSQSFMFSINVGTGEIIVNRTNSTWNDSSLWIDEIGVNP